VLCKVYCYCTFPDDTYPVVAHFEEHKSIAYGADWCRLDQSRQPSHTEPLTSPDNDSANNGTSPSDGEGQIGDTSQTNNPMKRGAGDSASCEERTSEHLIATCSFYDHLLKLWTFNDITIK